MNKAPEFLRVKRRRDEDSVQALLLDEMQRKKRVRFVFKLTKTVNQDSYADEEEATTPLLKLSEEADQRHFVLEQHINENDGREGSSVANEMEARNNEKVTENLPPEIAKMVDDYLKLNKDDDSTVSKPKKPSRKHFPTEVAHLPSLDYVYDIYHLEQVPEDEVTTYEKNNIGYIKMVNKNIELIPDVETDSDLISDDEDSNDENYYQNDYPEDEDDDRSILFGNEGEEIAEEEERNNPDRTDLLAIPTDWEHNQDQLEDEETQEYGELFSKLEGTENILASLNNSNVIDLDTTTYEDMVYDEEEEDENMEQIKRDTIENGAYERNEFFPTDQDDPMAQYRDKIFGSLQNMIESKK